MTKEVRDAIMKVRASGRSNMLDLRMVQYIANEMGLYALVVYIEEHKAEYVKFIMTGQED